MGLSLLATGWRVLTWSYIPEIKTMTVDAPFLFPEELSWKHHLAMWSFPLVLVGTPVGIVGSALGLAVGYITPGDLLLFQTLILLVACLHVLLLGDYIISASHYWRKVREEKS